MFEIKTCNHIVITLDYIFLFIFIYTVFYFLLPIIVKIVEFIPFVCQLYIAFKGFKVELNIIYSSPL